MNHMRNTFLTVLLMALVVPPMAQAQYTNYWTNSTSGTWFWTNTSNWSSNAVPDANTFPKWTNNAATVYTVQFTEPTTTRWVEVTSDKITYDLNGQLWYAPSVSAGVGSRFATGAGETSTVTFSSSSAGTNTANFNSGNHGWFFGNGTSASTLLINTNLGFGARVILPRQWNVLNANIIVSGPGAELIQPNQVTPHANGANILIENGGLYVHNTDSFSPTFSGHSSLLAGRISTTRVINAEFNTALTATVPTRLAESTRSLMIISNNATWRLGRFGLDMSWRYDPWAGTTDPYLSRLVVDDSDVYSAGKIFVGTTDNTFTVWGLGDYRFANNALVVSSNGHFVVNSGTYTAGGIVYSNRLTMIDSTIVLGGTVLTTNYNGALTNRGIFAASGVIRGAGAGKALVRSEGLLQVGNSVGTLVLSNANLEIAAGSITEWELSDTGLDQILAEDGYATLQGTNLFSLASGSALPEPGYKWGLGTYDFVVASNLTWDPQYANITNVLNGYGLVENLDYTFGVVSLGDGSQALRLAFVPEPSTVVLLLGGGLVLWRAQRRRA